MKRSLLAGLGGYFFLALVPLYAFVVGKISVRQVGIDYAALFVFGTIALTVILQRSHRQSKVGTDALGAVPDPKERQANRKSARNYIVAIVIMCLLLIYGLLDGSGYPLWVTFIGAAINICIICVLAITARSKMRIANHGNLSNER